MTRFVEVDAESLDAVKGVVSLRVDPGARYLISVDVSGCSQDEERARMKRAGESSQRLLGGSRILVMPERDGRPMARVFALEADVE